MDPRCVCERTSEGGVRDPALDSAISLIVEGLGDGESEWVIAGALLLLVKEIGDLRADLSRTLGDVADSVTMAG